MKIFNFALCLSSCRNSYPEVFRKNGVSKNFAKFTGKHMCRISFLIKFRFRTATLLKRDPFTGVSYNFIKKDFCTGFSSWILRCLQQCFFCRTFVNGNLWSYLKLIIHRFWSCFFLEPESTSLRFARCQPTRLWAVKPTR